MGDDPYDFDIAIPSGKTATAAKGKTRAWDGGRHSGSDDSDASESSGGSGGSGSGSDVSLSDSEDFRAKKKSSAQSTRGGGSGRAAASARGGGGAGGAGSSALDKAKSFLSKYSSKPTGSTSATTPKAASSARSRRLEMSLDDEDFSLDSSGEEIQKPTAKAATASKERVTRKQSSESEQDEAEESAEPTYTKPMSAAVTKSRYESSDDDADDRPQPVKTRVDATPTIASVASKYESEDEESDAPAPVRSTTWTSSYGAPQVKVIEKDDEDDAESIASQSEMEESVDLSKATAAVARSQPTVVVTQTLSKPRQISAMSESGVYEEEDFEEDSVQANAAAVTNTQPAKPISGTSRPREEESNFDYSLDFAEDQESASLPAPVLSGVTTAIREDENDEREERRSRYGSSSSESNRNSYVDDGEDEDGDGEPDSQAATRLGEVTNEVKSVPTANTTAVAAERLTQLLESENYSQDDVFESASVVMATTPSDGASEKRAPVPTASPQLANDLPSMTIAKPFTSESPQMPGLMKAPAQTRSRVIIVREYEQNSTEVEKRDASTQFTGNHAGIQTDLIPDGMLTSVERKNPPKHSPDDIPHAHHMEQDSTPLRSSSIPPAPPVPQPQPPVPGPPPSPFATYGLYDPLQLPVATSMSIYKQQLVALQHQIHQKKLETERIFRDRMATRYASLRSTDKFLAANRPSQIPLWEALLRVDPTLDERRAKEIAGLAANAAQ